MPFLSRRTLTVVALAALVTAGIPSRVFAAPPLADRIAPLIEAHEGDVAVFIKHLATGESFAHRETAPMPTASLIKFPIMVEAYRQALAGSLDLNATVTLKDADRVPGSGILTSHFSPGAAISLRDAIRLMIAFSDNTATNLVLERVGLEQVCKAMTDLGLPETRINAFVFRGDTSIALDRSRQFGLGSTTAAEVAKLFEMLYRDELADDAFRKAMKEHLLACEDKEKIAAGLPAGVAFAHKTGAVSAVRCDAGVIELPSGPLIICVLTANNRDQRWSPDNAACRLCAAIGLAAYEHFSTTNSASEPSTLAVGSAGEVVKALQRTLNARLTPSPELSLDGDFGPLTREAVKRFQSEHHLTPTGDADAATWSALGPLLMSDAQTPAPADTNAAVLPRSPPEDLDAPPETTCKAWTIADGRAGERLWGHNDDQPLDFASTTKIMTAHLVLSLADSDPAVLDETVVFSERADATIGSSAELLAGERLPVRELLYGLLLPSGNDASVALAEHFGERFDAKVNEPPAPESDPLELFVSAMNFRAQGLGMHSAAFRNPHGLTAPGHRASALDLARLAHAAMQRPAFRELVATRQHGCTVTGESGYTRNIVWKNTNKLLSIEGYRGVKTGTTDAAGACLVSLGERDGESLIVVVLGAANSDARYSDTRNLFRWAWRQRIKESAAP